MATHWKPYGQVYADTDRLGRCPRCGQQWVGGAGETFVCDQCEANVTIPADALPPA